MKTRSGAIAFVVLISTMIFFASCNKSDPTVGNLHITIIDTTGNPVSSVMAHLSTDKTSILNAVYSNTGWTDGSGNVRFQDLTPGYYWYGVPGWQDIGAVQVYAGIDQYVYLYLNSPVLPKK